MYGIQRTNHITPEEGAKLSAYVNTLPQQTTYNPLNLVTIGSHNYNVTNVPIFTTYPKLPPSKQKSHDTFYAKILLSIRESQ